MASHNFTYKDVNYSVYLTEQKDGRWDWAYTMTKPPIYWRSHDAPAGSQEKARFHAERRIDAL
ncbi:hypothetical protein [Paraburkholderia terrae]